MSESPHPWQEIFETDRSNSFLAQYHITLRIDEDLSNGQFAQIDQALAELPLESLSSALLVSILSSTLPARQRLTERAPLAARIAAESQHRGEGPEMFDGLL